MSVASDGQLVSYLDPDGGFKLTEMDLMDEFGLVESELIQVNVGFIGEYNVVLEENLGFSGFQRALSSGNARGEEYENVYGSPPDRLMTEIYQFFAKRRSPGGNGASRRQRRREKEKQMRMKKWEPEHFVKILNCSTKLGRPLQGLWKGICDDMSLDFYLVSYDDFEHFSCQKVGDSVRPRTYHTHYTGLQVQHSSVPSLQRRISYTIVECIPGHLQTLTRTMMVCRLLTLELLLLTCCTSRAMTWSSLTWLGWL